MSPHKVNSEFNKKALKRKTLVGPWRNVSEFQEVCDWMFSDDADIITQQRALSEMNVWHLRRSSLCPAAVVATKELLEVQLKDAQGSGLSDAKLQAQYAYAMVRFYNFMSSTVQAVDNFRTMYDAARHLSLPSFVVDLRHICAHGQVLPNLDALRTMSKFCIQWIRDYFWLPQSGVMCDIDATKIRRIDHTEFTENMEKLYVIYDAALECYMRGGRNMKSSKKHVRGKRLLWLKDYYYQHDLKEMKDIFNIIVKDLDALLASQARLKDLCEINIEAMTKMDFFFKVSSNRKRQKDILTELTQSLFRLLANKGFIENFFRRLLQIADNTSESFKRSSSAGFWAKEISSGFAAYFKCKQLYKKYLDRKPRLTGYDFASINSGDMALKIRLLYKRSKVNIKRGLIFGEAPNRPYVWLFERDFFEKYLKSMNKFTAPVLRNILPLLQPPLSEEESEQFRELIDANFPSKKEVESVGDKDDAIHTLEDLLELQPEVKEVITATKVDEDEVEQYGLWTCETDETHHWPSCPIGRLPWH